MVLPSIISLTLTPMEGLIMRIKLKDRSVLATRIKAELIPIIEMLQSIVDDIGLLQEDRIGIPSIISSCVIRIGLKLSILPGKISRAIGKLSEDMLEDDYVIPPIKYVIMYRNRGIDNRFKYVEFRGANHRFLMWEFYSKESAIMFTEELIKSSDYASCDMLVVGILDTGPTGAIRKARTIYRNMRSDRINGLAPRA